MDELEEDKGRDLMKKLPSTSWVLGGFTVKLQRVAGGGVKVVATVAKPMMPGWLSVGLGSSMANLPMVVGFIGADGVKTYKSSASGKPVAASCTGTTDVTGKSIKKVGMKYQLTFTAKNLCGASLDVSPLTLSVALGTGATYIAMTKHTSRAMKGVFLQVP